MKGGEWEREVREVEREGRMLREKKKIDNIVYYMYMYT